jgi:TPR repeat protein
VINSPEHAYKSASYIIENVQYLDASQQKMYCEIAVKTLKKLSTTSHYEGMFALGNLYVHGIPGFASTHVVNHHKAYQLYSSCAKGNHYDAMYHTARCLELGLGTQINFNRALHYYRKAATAGNHPGAMCRLALCLLNSQLGQSRAPREGLKWLRLAAKYANEKYPQALYELAMLHDKGLKNLVWQDHKYSVDLLVKAAEYKLADAQYKLGEGYEYGKFNLPIAPAKSVYYYSLSAAQGHLEAMFELGGWYLTGTSDAPSDFVLPQSDTDAYRWVKRAADGKLPCAMFAIGYFSEKGIGCEIDSQEAIGWYQKAALAGDAKAIDKLNDKGLSINMKNGKVTAKNVSTRYHETTTPETEEMSEVHVDNKVMAEKGMKKLKKKGNEGNCIIQ